MPNLHQNLTPHWVTFCFAPAQVLKNHLRMPGVTTARVVGKWGALVPPKPWVCKEPVSILCCTSASGCGWLLLPSATSFGCHMQSGRSFRNLSGSSWRGPLQPLIPIQPPFEVLRRLLSGETLEGFSPRPTMPSFPKWASLSGRGHLKPHVTCWLAFQLQ